MCKNLAKIKSKFLIIALLTLMVLVIPITVKAVNTLPSNINGIIKLEEDVTLPEFAVEKGKDNTIDLNGNELTTNITVNGTLTVIDSSTKGNGVIKSTESIKVDGGTFNLKSGSIQNDKDYGCYALNDGKINVSGGKINSLYAPLTGNNTTGAMTFKISGGTIEAKYGPAIYMPGPIRLDITDGEIIGGIGLRMGIVNISGGTINAIKSDIDSPKDYYHYSGNAWLPDALYVLNGTYTTNIPGYTNDLKMNITGGTFNCENMQGSAIAIYDLAKVEQNSTINISEKAILKTNAVEREAYQVLSLKDIGVESPKTEFGNEEYANKVSTEISGGIFNTKINESYIKENYYAEKQKDGMYIVYSKIPDQVIGLKLKTQGYNDLTIEWTEQNYVTGYELCDEDGKIVTTTTNNSYKASDLKEGTTYKFKVRAYKTIEGQKYYGEYSSILTVETKTRSDISKYSVTGISNKTYTGKALTQSITVKDNNTELKNNIDYTVSYLNNVNLGKATVTITGKGDYKGTITKSFIIIPTQVTGLKVSSQTTNSIKLTWSKVTGVTGYKVYSYNYSKNKWEYVGKTNENTYMIEKLNAGTTYKYRVRAYKNVDDVQYFGSYSSSVKTATKPTTVTGIKIKAEKSNQLKITWSKVSGASGYEIYMATSKNGKYTKIKTITKGSTVNYTKTKLTAGKTYYFKVKAYRTVDNNKIYATESSEKSATARQIYTVKKGDTLYSIAKKYKVTINKLIKLNGIKKANLIRIGMKLIIK